jgi:hypothetical protein
MLHQSGPHGAPPRWPCEPERQVVWHERSAWGPRGQAKRRDSHLPLHQCICPNGRHGAVREMLSLGCCDRQAVVAWSGKDYWARAQALRRQFAWRACKLAVH